MTSTLQRVTRYLILVVFIFGLIPCGKVSAEIIIPSGLETDISVHNSIADSQNLFPTVQSVNNIPKPSAINGSFANASELPLTIAWTRQLGTSGNDEAHGVAVDSLGNVYVAGYTDGTLPGQTSAGGSDVFVRKYDNSGNVVWTRQFGTSPNHGEHPNGIAVDSQGNVYVAGETAGTFSGQTSAGLTDAFVSKLDSSGNVLWTRQFGTSGIDYANEVAVDSLGNVYVAGLNNQTNAPGQTSGDAFVSKLDSSGNVLWTRQFGTSGWDYAHGVAVDSSGNVYAAGSFSSDAYVRKLDSSGNVLWTRQFGTDFIAYDVVVDISGNSYVSGSTGLAYVRKLDSSGNVLWTSQFGSSRVAAYKAAVDISGNIFVSGETNSAFPGQTYAGGSDAFVSKLDSSGNVLWTSQFGTSGNDYADGVAVDSLGNVYAAGPAGGALPGQQHYGGYYDAFVIKFTDTTAPTAAITYSVAGPYKSGSSVTITATFNEAMADSPVVQIAVSGASTLAATAMTKTSTTVYTYAYTVGAGNGTATVAMSIGTDVAGNIVTAAPTSGATFTVDNTAPTNQNTVFATSMTKNGGASVTIVSSGDATNNIWFAPSGTTTFAASATMTKTVSGTATTILAPATAGTYYLYVIDAAGNISSLSTATLTVTSCFIATAAYGTPAAEQIGVLRQFRDEVLLNNEFGAAFVTLYYRTTPPIADFISEHEVLRTIVREGFVEPLVAVVKYTQIWWGSQAR